jgi:ribosome-associated toxin RatA of RatAB toxin-antitoxin module
MADPAKGSIEIDAPVDHVYATITDFDTVPEWQSACVEANVQERDEDGRAVVVELKLDMKIRQPRYRNRYTHSPPTHLEFEMIDGDIKSVKGGYTFEDLGGDRTRVTYENLVDPGFYVPGPVRRKIAEAAVNDLLKQLKARAEATK